MQILLSRIGVGKKNTIAPSVSNHEPQVGVHFGLTDRERQHDLIFKANTKHHQR